MDEFKLYLDTPTLFECSVGLEGVSYRNAFARIVADTGAVNLLFNGMIAGQGDCSVPIPAVGGLYIEGTTGTLRLEVIADEFYFNAFEMPFVVTLAKKVTVEAANQADVAPEAPAVRIEEPIQSVPDVDVEVALVEDVVQPPVRKVTIKKKDSMELMAAEILKAFKS